MGFNNAHLIQRIGSWIKHGRTHNCIVSQVEFLMWAARSPVSTSPNSNRTQQKQLPLVFILMSAAKTSRARTLPLHIWILGLVNFMGTSFFHILFSRLKFMLAASTWLYPGVDMNLECGTLLSPSTKIDQHLDHNTLKKCQPGPPTVESGHKLLRIGDMKHFVGIFVPLPIFPCSIPG